MLQGTEKIRPQAHHRALGLGHQAQFLQVGGTTLMQPEAGMVMTRLGPHGQAGRQGLGSGLAVAAAQAGSHQQFPGVDGGDAVAAAQFGEGEPVRSRRGLGAVGS